MAELRVSVVAADASLATPMLVLPAFDREASYAGLSADINSRMGGAIADAVERGDFRGRKDETLVRFPRKNEIGAQRVLLVGLGKPDEYTVERLRRAVGTAIRVA